jgi:hypothetical protein
MARSGGRRASVEQGGEAILHLAAGDDVADKSGLFFTGMMRRKPIRKPMTKPPASGCARSASN